MIFGAVGDGFGPVELFQSHDPHKVMGESHRAEGQTEVCHGLDPGIHSEGGSDEETGRTFATELDLLDLLRQGFRRKLLPLRGQDAEPRAFGDLGFDEVCFLGEACPDLCRCGILRETGLRQLKELKFTVGPQPLGIFLCGGKVELLLALTHSDQSYRKHGIALNGGSLPGSWPLLLRESCPRS